MWQFWSLYQGERTNEENEAFEEALGRMDEWYGHQGAVTMCMRELPDDWLPVEPHRRYEARGWCYFELRASQLAKPSHHCLDVGKFSKKYSSDGRVADMDTKALREQAEQRDIQSEGSIMHSLVQGFRRAPCTPAAFDEGLVLRSFTNDADKQVVSTIYANVARKVLSGIKELDFSDLKWEVDDFKDMGEALRLCGSLKLLGLSSCGMDDQGAMACFGPLRKRSLPQLEHLLLFGNPNLRNAGGIAIAEAVKRGAMPLCTDLGSNRCIELEQGGRDGEGNTMVKATKSIARALVEMHGKRENALLSDNEVRQLQASAKEQPLPLEAAKKYATNSASMTVDPRSQTLGLDHLITYSGATGRATRHMQTRSRPSNASLLSTALTRIASGWTTC